MMARVKSILLPEILFYCLTVFSCWTTIKAANGCRLCNKDRNIQLSVGPTNATRIDGDRDLLIPCIIINMPENFYPIWEVNGTVYDITSLPNIYQPVSNGLLVLVTSKHMNNTSFRCIFPKKKHSILLQKSPLGFLTVLSGSNKDTESDSKISFANSGPQLSIDHQTLFFDNDTTVLAWKVLQPNRECQNNFKVEAKRDCADPSSVMKTWTLHGRNISIQSFDYNLVTASVDEMPVYFNITSRDTEGNACQEMISDIQFNNSTITKKTIISRVPVVLDINTLNATMYIAFPVNQADMPDCLCPIIILKEDDCYNLEQCHCANEAVILNSAEIVNVCHNSSTGKLSLYIQNIKRTDNNTHLHCYNSKVCNHGSSGQLIREYIDSFKIIQAIPEQPRVNIGFSHGQYEVCISDSKKEFVNKYEISMFDITGEMLYYVVFLDKLSVNCTSFPFDLQSKCAPYIVSVTASNSFANNTQNASITLPNQPILRNQSVCSCLKDSVQVVMSATFVSTELHVMISCQKKYFSDIKLEIKLMPINTSKTILCSEATVGLEFSQLDCNIELYDVNVLWISTNDSLRVNCLVQTSSHHPSLKCCHKTKKILIAFGSLTLLILVLSMVVAFTVRRKCKIKVNINSQTGNVQAVTYQSIGQANII